MGATCSSEKLGNYVSVYKALRERKLKRSRKILWIFPLEISAKRVGNNIKMDFMENGHDDGRYNSCPDTVLCFIKVLTVLRKSSHVLY
jgi:hypothetical protein